MRLTSLQTRLTIPIIVMLLIVQGAGYFVIKSAVTNNARASLEESLSVTERVFQQVLDSNREQLAQAATVTAADFGFRKAVALDSRDTVSSALLNQAERIHAKIALLMSLDGTLIADSRDQDAVGKPGFAPPGLLDALQSGKMSSGLYMIDRHLYQLVAVPVKAPLPLAYVVMGSPVDDALATRMRGLTLADVTFIGQLKTGAPKVFASSLPVAGQDKLLAVLSPPGTPIDAAHMASLKDTAYAARALDVGSEGNQIVAVLERSVDVALAPYIHLQSVIFVLTLIGIALSLSVSFVTARKVVHPVLELIRSTRRIGAGEYSNAIEVTSHDEIGELATAFNQMRQGISERENHIMDLAYRDAMTGLPNRALFNQRLTEALMKADANGLSVALLMIDLDRFKYVNDILGHHLGDVLLQKVGARMQGLVGRKDDLVARLGGDEFAMLLHGETVDGAMRVAQLLLDALVQPFSVEDQVLDVSGSIGIVAFPEDGRDMNTLLRHADIAMYAAKRGKTGFAIYQRGQDEQIAEHLSLMTELRHAVERDELILHYQPKMNLRDGEVAHVEALVRWRHPTRGLLAPIHFIPFAEQTGYVKVITAWVLNQAVAQCAVWKSHGLDLQVAVNVSVRDLVQLDLSEIVSACLQRYAVAPSRLWIEITESALLEDPAKAIAMLNKLNDSGINLSIDDFGTGYSSLSYLKRMPVHELKIDKSFVSGMAHDHGDETIVRSTIDLGHNMGLRVVAEGVESQVVMDRLQQLGCDLVQGYFLSEALDATAFEHWLLEHQRRAMQLNHPGLKLASLK